jgi:shikimate kinase
VKNIVLAGFMGTGKTVVGRAIAVKLKRRFVDMDRMIELRAGRPVADIFRLNGEAAFRALEREVVHEVARESDVVIAAGGGALLDSSNFQALSVTGHLICLTASPDVLMRRMRTDTSRPLLADSDKKERILELLKIREPAYRLCLIQISTDKKSVERVADEVIAAVQKAEGTL